MDYLTELTVREENFTNFHPERRAATKGGCLARFLQTRNTK
jgi:hypothetical protein